MNRVAHEPGYVLHHYDWSESSLIVEVFTRAHGRVALVAKGAKRPSSNFRAVLLPLQPLLLAWGGLTFAQVPGGGVDPLVVVPLPAGGVLSTVDDGTGVALFVGVAVGVGVGERHSPKSFQVQAPEQVRWRVPGSQAPTLLPQPACCTSPASRPGGR